MFHRRLHVEHTLSRAPCGAYFAAVPVHCRLQPNPRVPDAVPREMEREGPQLQAAEFLRQQTAALSLLPEVADEVSAQTERESVQLLQTAEIVRKRPATRYSDGIVLCWV